MKLLEVLEKDIASPVPKKKSTKEKIGLTSNEAAELLKIHGENRLKEKRKVHPLKIFLGQYKDIMTMILLICTAISVFMGEYVEAISIAAIVLMNGVLGFIQEYKTERTLEALKNMASPTSNVYRDGGIVKLDAALIVPSDVIILNAGDKIPADCEIIASKNLECDEAMLTGESIPVKKGIANPELYMGCVVTKGHCEARVTKTGMNTQMGEVASMINEIGEEKTPLSERLDKLSKYIAVGCLAICAVVSLTGILRGEDFLKMLITGVSLAVAAVPEGLPAIVTISLALSVSRMVKKNALVRRLHAVETLGCATVICSDKTGTLTENKMTATDIYLPNLRLTRDFKGELPENFNLLLDCAVLCNNSKINSKKQFGNHTETALLELAEHFGKKKESLGQSFRRLDEIPFDSERKLMSVLASDKTGDKFCFTKGAFDVMLPKCKFYLDGGEIRPMTQKMREQIKEESGKMADGALRVIGLSFKKLTGGEGFTEDNLVFLGLVGMIDPPRKEVKKAVSLCKKAGIKTVMITGDHKNTAIAIARQTGIFKEGDLSLTGAELDRTDDEKLSKIIGKVTVFSRVSPKHKLRIVRLLKNKGHIVAMTGDGVNDAPAIKEADIGVSMGINGTDVTKESSEIILMDDNFATLVGAVSEGRSIYDNIRKFIRYLLSCNIGEVVTMFFGMLFGMPVILLPIQILLVNLITDGLPAIALGLEPSDDRAMERKPRKPDESIFSNGLSFKIIIRGLLIGIATLASFVSVFKMTNSVEAARTGALFSLIVAQLIHVFECKSEEKSILEIPYFNNLKLIFASALSLITLLSVLYIPPLRVIFKTVPLTLRELALPLGFCFVAPIVNIFILKGKKKKR